MTSSLLRARLVAAASIGVAAAAACSGSSGDTSTAATAANGAAGTTSSAGGASGGSSGSTSSSGAAGEVSSTGGAAGNGGAIGASGTAGAIGASGSGGASGAGGSTACNSMPYPDGGAMYVCACYPPGDVDGGTGCLATTDPSLSTILYQAASASGPAAGCSIAADEGPAPVSESPGECCYWAHWLLCGGRPLFVAGVPAIASVVRRREWAA